MPYYLTCIILLAKLEVSVPPIAIWISEVVNAAEKTEVPHFESCIQTEL